MPNLQRKPATCSSELDELRKQNQQLTKRAFGAPKTPEHVKKLSDFAKRRVEKQPKTGRG